MKMLPQRLRSGCLGVTLIGMTGLLWAQPLVRTIPQSLPDHPGNVFLSREEVGVSLPKTQATEWQAVDYDGKTIASGRVAEGPVRLGKLAVGYYEIRLNEPDDQTAKPVSLGVLSPLMTPTPLTSPVALDVAAAWFYPPATMPAVANLCSLAGINWVRDRLTWAEMEPGKGRFAATNRYDLSAQIQTMAGLRVLQVIHLSPGWANHEQKRFPLDLRDAYIFFREMARRWTGTVPAFEPWNEADIEIFGGHTGSEIASLQKAAYLGLKAGNPEIIACQNVFALHPRAQLEDFQANQAWPYFDTFNLHHYAPLTDYPALYADFRAVSAGRPLWVTECNIPVKWTGDEKRKEPSELDLRVQSERVAKIFAASLFEGAAEVFYFLLPHYSEGQTQFGVLRPDLTPRPAFLALAAVGRLLADAQPLGQWKPDSPSVQGYVMRARPDGQEREVWVVWSPRTAKLNLPQVPERVYDHLGRQQSVSGQSFSLGPAPLFLLMPEGASTRIRLTPPPKPAERLPGQPSPVVLQALWPTERLDLRRSAYRLKARQPETIPVSIYNFGSVPVSGTLWVTSPEGWTVRLPKTFSLAALARETVGLSVLCTKLSAANATAVIRLDVDCGERSRALLSLPILPEED